MKLATLLHDLFLYIPKFNFEGAYTWSAPTMGWHHMLTEKAIVVTNALRGDLSTVNVRN